MTAKGFTRKGGKAGEVKILHHGPLARTLRAAKAREGLDLTLTADDGSVQHEAARLTGNYKRGNERLAKGHPRNA